VNDSEADGTLDNGVDGINESGVDDSNGKRGVIEMELGIGVFTGNVSISSVSFSSSSL